VTAGAAVGSAAKAKGLVGGSNNSIALQPLSLEGQTGLNLAVGVEALELRLAPSLALGPNPLAFGGCDPSKGVGAMLKMLQN
jgi:uncharacterized protein DUF992